jgi:hypothetical protein
MAANIKEIYMKTRMYKVTEKATGKVRLIDAFSTDKAIVFVAGGKYECKVAKAADIAELVGSGVKVEQAR